MIAQSLSDLQSFSQFILYRLEPKPGVPGKMNKIPVDPSGRNANAHDARNWMDYDTAEFMAIAHGPQYGVGFVLTTNDPFFCLDIDNCATDGAWMPYALAMLARFPGCAVERSCSGHGLHIWGRTTTVPPHRSRVQGDKYELYTEGRFIALGDAATGCAATDATAQLASVVAEFFPQSTTGATSSASSEWTTEPREEYTGPEDYLTLLSMAMADVKPSAMFEGKASFLDLFERNVETIAISFPSSNPGEDYDDSAADMALASHLAYWTGCNCERMREIMLTSALVRPKWSKANYLERTILAACSRKIRVYDRPRATDATPAKSAPVAEQPIVTGKYIDMSVIQFNQLKVAAAGIVTGKQQAEIFRNFVYDNERQKMVNVKNLESYDKTGFDALIGRRRYAVDAMGEQSGVASGLTKSAWEAALHNELLTVMSTQGGRFRPDVDGETLQDESGRPYYNTYIPPVVKRRTGDTSPFTDWFEGFIESAEDRTMLLSWLAHVAQKPAVKITWAPFVQGCEGCGKTSMTDALRYALGNRYVTTVDPKKIGEKFNGWMEKSVLAIVDEVRDFSTSQNSMLESMKTLITATVGSIEKKGQEQRETRTFFNTILCSNHKDGIRINDGMRRYAPFFSRWQNRIEMEREGFGDKARRFKKWIETEEGREIMNDFLLSYKICTEFNPVCAPYTSSREDAVAHGQDAVESAICDALALNVRGRIDENIIDIYGITEFVKETVGNKVSSARVRHACELLGYIPAPAFTRRGISDNKINGKYRQFYVKAGTMAEKLPKLTFKNLAISDDCKDMFGEQKKAGA